jgi:hypothetical protein
VVDQDFVLLPSFLFVQVHHWLVPASLVLTAVCRKAEVG